jgi:hypothetical protein
MKGCPVAKILIAGIADAEMTAPASAGADASDSMGQ